MQHALYSYTWHLGIFYISRYMLRYKAIYTSRFLADIPLNQNHQHRLGSDTSYASVCIEK